MIPVLDLVHVSSLADAERELAQLAHRHPVIRTRQANGVEAWTVLGAALSRKLLGDPRLSNDLHAHAPDAAQNPGAPIVLFEQDNPDHARYRRLVSAAFASRAVRALEPRLVDIARGLLDGLPREGTADFIAAFANPFPLEVICELLGVPLSDREVFHTRVKNMDSPSAPVRRAATDAFAAYCANLVEAKRQQPTEDLLSELVTARLDDGASLTQDELVGFCSILLFAGHVTTAFVIASALLELLTRPDQLAALRADPSLVAGTTEEAMRFRGSLLSTTNRVALADIEADGVVIRRGELVRFLLSAANRDPAVREDPHTFDILRPTPAHLGFGHGPHFCLGHQLARQEIKVALAEVLSRFPVLELAVPPHRLRWRSSDFLRGLAELPVRYAAGS
ncbi:cytochrome P450 [Streptomyces sp. UNOC14_S4]|uniref:cytochrome P450 family protein n=1 Tax=Streptomyces sp. UNOC14_S4 TaxID=2872340 RepID=UPI001E29D8E2|nr:cytochrome P450 [Streptomyces sp. UNOC14_S4]MCC3769026.1 cytochrome P450 [Streptomyces sp. UNOC14_S4]